MQSSEPADYAFADRLINRIALREATAQLTPRQRRVLRLWARGEELSALAPDLGISRARVFQIRIQAIRRAIVNTRLKLQPTTLTGPPPGFDHAAFQRHMAFLRGEKQRKHDDLLHRERKELLRLIDGEQSLPPKFKPPPLSLPPKFKPPPQVLPAYIPLLRIPHEQRTTQQKMLLAAYLEREFVSRGAGVMKPAEQGSAQWLSMLNPQDVALAKYDWFVNHLERLWENFPPAPVL